MAEFEYVDLPPETVRAYWLGVMDRFTAVITKCQSCGGGVGYTEQTTVLCIDCKGVVTSA